MESALRNDSGRPSVSDDNSDPASRPSRVITEVARPLTAQRSPGGAQCS